eukprot:scaffold73342_cov33-Tisochrysis_lutea.AAC.3
MVDCSPPDESDCVAPTCLHVSWRGLGIATQTASHSSRTCPHALIDGITRQQDAFLGYQSVDYTENEGEMAVIHELKSSGRDGHCGC